MDNFIVISNSTPMILLQKVGQLELLKSLYSEIYIPEAVYKEVIIDSAGKNKDDDFISAHDWIKIIKIQDTKSKKLFKTSLHEGEVETILLALEMSADLCLLDDLLARKYAKSVGINISGTLGVLITAKNKSYVKEVKPILEQLLSAGMYINAKLYASVLSTAKEI